MDRHGFKIPSDRRPSPKATTAHLTTHGMATASFGGHADQRDGLHDRGADPGCGGEGGLRSLRVRVPTQTRCFGIAESAGSRFGMRRIGANPTVWVDGVQLTGGMP